MRYRRTWSGCAFFPVWKAAASLYILQPLVDVGWLNTGPKIVRYIKRMPALAVVFVGAWASTRYYEHWWIAQGKRWSRRLDPVSTASPRPKTRVADTA
jgi:peptidoglycan/LPS O-acetylase OafA/YrhL